MGQKIYWALLGKTMTNGKLSDVEIIRVVEDDEHQFNMDKTYYTTSQNFENKLIAEDVEGLIEQLDEIKRDILLHGIKFIDPGESHIKHLDVLKSNQNQMNS